MYINASEYVRLYKNNYIWSGRMGGQWAFTPELLSMMTYGKILILFGGVGDLGINLAIYNDNIEKIDIVDYSAHCKEYFKIIIDFLTVNEDITEVKKMMNYYMIKNEMIKHIIPNELIEPNIVEFYTGNFTDIDENNIMKINFIVEDIIKFISNNKLDYDFIYVASPTKLPKYLLPDDNIYFFQHYSDADNDNLKVTYEEENHFPTIINIISNKIKDGTVVITGVGEGDIPLSKYEYVFENNFREYSVPLFKHFIIKEADNYKFKDWIVCGIK